MKNLFLLTSVTQLYCEQHAFVSIFTLEFPEIVFQTFQRQACWKTTCIHNIINVVHVHLKSNNCDNQDTFVYYNF